MSQLASVLRMAGVAAVVAALFGTAACGSGSGSAQDNPDNLIQPGVVTAATQATQPPFAMADATGQPTGFAIDLANAVAARLHLRIEYRSTTLTGMLAGLSAGSYDIGIAGVGDTKAREQSVGFTKPFYWGYTAVLTASSNPAGTLAAFTGQRVGVVVGSVQETFAKQKLAGATITEFQDQTSAIAQLTNGGLTAVVLGGTDAEQYVKRYPQLHVAVRQDAGDGTAFPVRKGNSALTTAFDQAIDQLISDGSYAKLYQKWFSEPVSPELVKARPDLGKALAGTPIAPSTSG